MLHACHPFQYLMTSALGCAVVAELGERSASKQLGISRQTIYRVLAGLGCYPGTAAQLDARLPTSGDPS
jgi:hypothetical protein